MRTALWLALLLLHLQAAPLVAQTTADGTQTYTVVAGDTLFVIAQRFGVSLDDLIAANGIVDPNRLEIGQVLIIPAPGVSATAQPLDGLETTLLRARPGDTVTSIAAGIGQSPTDLAEANALPLHARLFPGQPLRVPRDALPEQPLRFGAIQAVDFPERLLQGRTGMVTVSARRDVSLNGTWNGLPLTFLPVDGDARRQFAYLPVPALIAPSAYWFTLSYTANNGLQLNQAWLVAVGDGAYERQEINLPPDRGGLLAPELVQAEFAMVSALWNERSPALFWPGAFSLPIGAEYPTTSPFGIRRSYNGGPYSDYHAGQDFGAPTGVPVLVPGDGIVVLAEMLTVRGGAVIIDHGAGVFSGYWHLSEITVAPGQAVNQGDVLGLVGNTGLSTGAHLHWELRIYGVAVDPMQFLDETLAPAMAN